ncbi:MAG: Nif11-like leader peptide family RiPP precursor [Acidaminococcaceae bacterium]|nr:Nif11-like leader peptide family RiPP precursor [Acidaminococcaceae bacterium]
MSDNKIVVTKEQIQKAMACETAEELMELAKEAGIELTKEEAEAYMAEIADVELDEDALKQVAGGGCYGDTVVCRCEQCRSEQEFSVQPD